MSHINRPSKIIEDLSEEVEITTQDSDTENISDWLLNESKKAIEKTKEKYCLTGSGIPLIEETELTTQGLVSLTKDFKRGYDPSGGYYVPNEIADMFAQKLNDDSPMRRAAKSIKDPHEKANFDKEVSEWNLAAYGKIIRGDEDTSEDQVAEAVTPTLAKLLVDRFNNSTTTKIKIGSIFRYRHNGQHDDCEIVILYDDKLNERFLYNMTYKVRIGISHLLYAEFTGKRLTKKEIKELKVLLK